MCEFVIFFGFSLEPYPKSKPQIITERIAIQIYIMALAMFSYAKVSTILYVSCVRLKRWGQICMTLHTLLSYTRLYHCMYRNYYTTVHPLNGVFSMSAELNEFLQRRASCF